MSEEKTWYFYQNSQQLGPFTEEHIRDQIAKNIISQETLVFKTGWKDWQKFKDCKEFMTPPVPPVPTQSIPTTPPPPNKEDTSNKEQRKYFRKGISGTVIIHDSHSLSLNKGVNISVGGIFIATSKDLFDTGSIINLTCKIAEISKPFHAKAKVIHKSSDPQGYGLEFIELSPSIKKIIEELTDK